MRRRCPLRVVGAGDLTWALSNPKQMSIVNPSSSLVRNILKHHLALNISMYLHMCTVLSFFSCCYKVSWPEATWGRAYFVLRLQRDRVHRHGELRCGVVWCVVAAAGSYWSISSTQEDERLRAGGGGRHPLKAHLLWLLPPAGSTHKESVTSPNTATNWD